MIHIWDTHITGKFGRSCTKIFVVFTSSARTSLFETREWISLLVNKNCGTNESCLVQMDGTCGIKDENIFRCEVM